MKKMFFILILLIFVSVIIPAQEKSVSSDKTRIAILDFSAKKVGPELADAVVENLTTELVNTGEFQMLERNQMEKLMEELKLQNSDDFNDEFRQELGNLYGAEIAILGSITMIGDTYTLNVRGVQISSGVIQFAKKVSYTDENELPPLLTKLANMIAGKEVEKDENIKDTLTGLPINKFSRIAKPMRAGAGALTAIGILTFIGGFTCLGLNIAFQNVDMPDHAMVLYNLEIARNTLLIVGSVSIGLSIPLWILYGVFVYKAKHYKNNQAFNILKNNNKIAMIPEIGIGYNNVDLSIRLLF